MSDTPLLQEETREAEVKSAPAISRIWLVPFVAVSIGAWMLYHQWSNKGPEITIEFQSATGLEAEKTKIRTRDVELGVVRKIELKPDLSGVIVTARMKKEAEPLLRQDNQFWIVRPRVSLSGVSGLSTLLSGPYIAMEPGENGVERTDFVALEGPPVTPIGTPGLHITLNSDDEFAFKEGDPIIYKGLKVGEFEDIYFNIDEQIVYYNVFIKAPYHNLITQNTKFWNISGIRLDLEASGVTVQTGSLETMLTNGVTFGVPDGIDPGERIEQRTDFNVYHSYDDALEARFKLGAQFVILIEETVRGLQVGAPVEYRGLEIGKVVEINPPLEEGDRTLLDKGYQIPVILSIHPSRVSLPDNRQGLEFIRSQILHWLSDGLRASLKVGNLLTGGLYVDLQHYPDAEPVEHRTFKGLDVLPVQPSQLGQITQKLSDMLDTVNGLPLANVTDNLNTSLQSLNQTLIDVQSLSSELTRVAKDTDTKALFNQLHSTLQQMDQVLASVSDGSRGQQELLRTVEQFQRAMQELTPLLQQLNQQPSRLIWSQDNDRKLEPKGASAAPEQNRE